MADFTAVLRKTIDALGHNTPEMREKVFDKARAAIESKLAAIDPPPPQAVIDRQRKALSDAIETVRAEYGAPSEGGEFAETGEEPNGDLPIADPVEESAGATDPALDAEPVPPGSAAGRKGAARGRSGLIAAVLALVVIAGAGYALWQNMDDIAELIGATDPVQIADTEDAAPAETDTALGEGTQLEAEVGETAAGQSPEKFTQRLLPDGTEIDEGPAGEEPRVGEGTSVATATGLNEEAEAAERSVADPAPSSQVAVGQRAIFYEQSTSSADGSAESGSIVWSLVRESPGGDAAPEPAIRAEVTIPAHSLQLRMTIRRNADQTLPASHIVEMIFLTPENFVGGAIDNVLRIAMKDTEEATGSPLLGIPAKIADGFFLVALGDSPVEIETNLALMRDENWIDIPVIYRSGRRALMTMEKGIPGERVFEEAIRAWQEATSG